MSWSIGMDRYARVGYIVLLASGCLDFASPGVRLPDARPYVTPDVASALDGEGHFTLADLSEDTPHPVVGRDNAGALAFAMVDAFLVTQRVATLAGAEQLRSSIENAYGGPVNWPEVTLGPRRSYAALFPFEPVPDDAPSYARNFWGPHYLVPMYVGGEQVLVVTVAAHASEVVIRSDGLLDFPDNSGNEFAGYGLPRGGTVAIPVEPETAVAEVATRFRRRIASVPRLLQPGRRVRFAASKWELVLDQPVMARRVVTGQTLTVDRLYVGVYGSVLEEFDSTVRLRFFAAAADQPAAIEAAYVSTGGSSVVVSLPRIADRPVDFVEVEPVR